MKSERIERWESSSIECPALRARTGDVSSNQSQCARADERQREKTDHSASGLSDKFTPLMLTTDCKLSLPCRRSRPNWYSETEWKYA